MSNIHKNFNSRTREGATKKQLGGRIGLLVSIHAPVWVRLYDVYIVIGLLEFQFTHPCGCDVGATNCAWPETGFNSRTRVGATRQHRDVSKTGPVSIHAPVWVRRHIGLLPHNNPRFQFTHPCGCDLQDPRSLPAQRRFNSRTRVGATSNHNIISHFFGVSIHAPVWVRLKFPAYHF